MCVAGIGDVFGRAAEFHRLRRLRDHGAGERCDDMNTKDPVGLGIGDDLHETVGLMIGLGA